VSQSEQQELQSLQKQLWDNGTISMWILREDTECLCFSDGSYTMLLWGHVSDDKNQLNTEAQHCFRILRYLGAPVGFCVNWWRIPNDRRLKAGHFPTRAEVNGGWARHGIPEVYIFRLEEWDRVLIHECIHAFDWDVMPSTTVKTCLEQSLGGQITEALFEAATELNAEWLWCIIHSPNNDFTGITWLKQITWQQSQAFAILARKPDIWSEDTSVFAYYVLKAVLALDMGNFLVSWLSGSVNTDMWCSLWSTHKQTFLEQSNVHKASHHVEISMRMTHPDLENFINTL